MDIKIMEKESIEISRLFETVVEGGYCVGCGACAAVADSPITIKFDEYGKLKATLKNEAQNQFFDGEVEQVCPFSDKSKNEDELGKELFEKQAVYHEKLGYHIATYAGYVKEGSFRRNGSSGGMGSWIANAMLTKGLADGVIHVHQRNPTNDDPRLFHYRLSTTPEQIKGGAKSRYYPIELSEIIQLIRNRPGRYVIIGIPCFIKAVRLLSKVDQLINERVAFCIGLICGHLKSARFAEMFSWQCGIAPGLLTSIDFRTKLKGYGANRYGVTVSGYEDGKEVVKISPPVNTMYGTNWGLGFFKYQACDYCDDVVAETADVTIGDAWLPQYVADSLGTNVLIVRNPIVQELLVKADKDQEINLDIIMDDDVVQSQSSGFNHRREGLAYRLYLKDKQGQWRPKKRVLASAVHLKKNIRKRHELRVMLAEQSHIGFQMAIQGGQFADFRSHMEPFVRSYNNLYNPPLWKRAGSAIKRYLTSFFNKK